ncbi:MAG TPA: hypothetical protein DIT13_04340 [Verrucomicrobiales bacterium]|nr:hypothetical protein [Verrucomicrobiales bacterium]HRJ08201.1 hypothetical protein [Prosthecobacter sp.]HRK16124.1 hypothetical protein [Prosthecobacter sp.]
MNTRKGPKIPQMLIQLRQLIQADSGPALVRRRDLRDVAQGEIQLELDLSPHGRVQSGILTRQ